MREPKNRIAQPLDILEIRVDHSDGSILTCPNGLAASAMWGMSGSKPSIPEKFLRPGSELFDPRTLRPVPDLRSVISGEPAVMYRSDDLEIPLSPEELFRLMKRNLRPEEYFVLLKNYGLFHEIHEDFYDDATGEAFQPMDGTDEDPGERLVS